MGRKRLLTILAAVTAAVGLQVGTAAAQTISLPGLGEITLGADECLEVGVDISLADALKLDPSICVDGDGVDVEGGVEAGGQKLDVGEVTEPVEQVTEDVAGAVKGAGDPKPTPTTPPSETPEPETPSGGGDGDGDDGDGDDGDDGNDGGDGSSAGGSEGSGGGDRSPDVAASGDATEPRTAGEDRQDRAAQLAALRAIRSDMAAGSSAPTAGPVRPFAGLSSTDDLAAAPRVADAEASSVVPGVDERLAPQVATAPDQREAILATSSPIQDLVEAPLALKLLASALVLGAAAVWTIASRELGRSATTTA